MPPALEAFAMQGLARLLQERQSLACALGEGMTEPKPKVWFDEASEDWRPCAVALDRRTRMMYDTRHLFINGESFRAGGADARLMQRLADHRVLDEKSVQRASTGARALLQDWFEAGWLQRAQGL
jgi:50S ribosomal protein L16 3-hydroxylase